MKPVRLKFLPAFLPFFLLATIPAFSQFETRGISAAPLFPYSVAVGDFNRDGKPDLAVASIESVNGFGTEIRVLLGNGDGTFQAPVVYTVGTRPDSIATADFNGDGNLDLVVTNQDSDTFSILLGLGDGTFSPSVSYANPQDPLFVTTGDFNNDGKIDVATLNLSDSTGRCDCVAIFLGNGDGTFQSDPIITTAALAPSSMGIGRFGNTGKLDIAVGEQFGATSQVEILLGNGDGTFNSGPTYPVCCDLQSIAVADFNGDHKEDLAIAENEGMGVGLLLGNGDGTFRPQPNVPANQPIWVAAADLEGNGRQDLVCANLVFPTGVSVVMGNGDGTFQPPILYRVGDTNRFATVGDFNGDRRPDIVVAASGTSYVEVLLNTGVVDFSPATPLNFKPQKHGTTSKPLTVKLTNTGSAQLKISSMKTSSQFEMTSTCGSSVAAGGTCTISVSFSPTSTGAKSGTVTINDSASSKPMVIELSGTGT